MNHTADIYSLGLLLYRLLNADRGPFLPLPPATPSFDDANGALSRRMNGEPLPKPAFASPKLGDVILRACAFEPPKRWQSARAFSDALKECANHRQNHGYALPASDSFDETVSAPLSTSGGGYSVNYSTMKNHVALSASSKKNIPVIVGSIAAAVAITVVASVAITSQRSADSTGSDRRAVSTISEKATEAHQEAETEPDTVIETPEPTPIPPAKYTLHSTANYGGTINPSGAWEYDEGETVEYTVVPNSGYAVDSVYIDGVTQYINSSGVYRLTADQSHTIQANFRQIVHRYEVVNDAVSWWDAMAAAQARGGHLATVSSVYELNEIAAAADRAGVVVVLLGGRVDWPRGISSWITDEPFDYSPWFSGEPNNEGNGETEDCIALMYVERFGGWGFCDVSNNAYTYYKNYNSFGYAIEWEE